MEFSAITFDFIVKFISATATITTALAALIGAATKITSKHPYSSLREQAELIHLLPENDARTARAVNHIFEHLEIGRAHV